MTTTAAADAARPGAPGFTGFPDDALAFYEGLGADNSRTYWQEHRDTYERAVRAPLQALLDGLAAEFGTARIMRPYRDVRFSADKAPYKLQAAAMVATGGAASLYVQLSAEGLLTGGGAYHLSRDQLARYRAAVQEEGPGGELERVVADLAAAGAEVAGDRLTRAPRGVDAGHPRIALLRHKGLVGMRDHGAPGWLSTAACADAVAADWRLVAPLDAWLDRHVGPAEEDERPGRPR